MEIVKDDKGITVRNSNKHNNHKDGKERGRGKAGRKCLSREKRGGEPEN